MSITTMAFWSSTLLHFGLYYKTGYCYLKAESGSMLNKTYIIWVH